MVNTVNITEDLRHGKHDNPGYVTKSRSSRRGGRRMFLPLLLMCLLAAAGRGTSVALMQPAAVTLARADAQQSFDKLKTLEGTWEGHVTTVPKMAQIEGHAVQVTLRVTSRGNALMHEMRISGIPDDPITMFYVEDGRFLLTHYCDAGNRPRMEGVVSPDGKTLKFNFLDVAGGMEKGHMHDTMFTLIDADHHVEDWNYMFGNQSVRAHHDLRRVK